MLIMFIYLAIGGIILSGYLIGLNEKIFKPSVRKTINNNFTGVGEKFLFGLLMAIGFILLWLPGLLFIIYRTIKELYFND